MNKVDHVCLLWLLKLSGAVVEEALCLKRAFNGRGVSRKVNIYGNTGMIFVEDYI